MTRPVPVWDGDPMYLVSVARKLLNMRDTDPDNATLQRQVMAAIEAVQRYLGFDFRDPMNAPISDVVTESCAFVLIELYRRKDANFGIVGSYSEDAVAVRISADWLAGHLPQLAPLRRGWGLG
jgi:phage gp36-like protein